jgi:hypothetical protein
MSYMKVTKNVPEPVPPATYTIEELSQDDAQFIRDLLGRVTAYSNKAYDVYLALHTALGSPSPQYKFFNTGGYDQRNGSPINSIKATKRD